MKKKPNLTGIPETMLWTLYNRVSEAVRVDGILQDEQALRIFRSLDYDFKKAFGQADGYHATRSLMFDNEVKAFLDKHPDGVIVNLGEGLETQRFRVDSEQSLWLSIDIPGAMSLRERYIQPDERHRHFTLSALDRIWFDSVPEKRPVYITAQGLLMYFEPAEVEALFYDLAVRFPGAWFVFDHIPVWLSRKTLSGWWKTPYYRTPAMPWGINRHEVETTLRSWVSNLSEVKTMKFISPRGFQHWFLSAVHYLPWVNHHLPGITRVHFI